MERPIFSSPSLRISIVAALLLSACGASTTASSDTTSSQSQGTTSDPASSDGAAESGFRATALIRYDEIGRELEGLSLEARRERLIELAKKEGGSVNFYGSTNENDSIPLVKAFKDATGIDVIQYRAGTAQVGQRLLQEAAANFPGADVVIVSGSDAVILEDAGVLAPFRSPVLEQIAEPAITEYWIGAYFTATVPVWNTDLVGLDFNPGTWEDVLRYSGAKAYAAIDAPWLASMVNDYFVGELGLTEEEALQIFREGAENASIVRGSTVRINMIAAGQYDLAVSVNQHGVAGLLKRASDAPVTWEPTPEPVFLNNTAIMLMGNATNPAAAMLWADFVLTDGQFVLAERGRTPTNVTVEGGFPFDKYRTALQNPRFYFEDAAKWDDLWEEITSRGTVVAR